MANGSSTQRRRVRQVKKEKASDAAKAQIRRRKADTRETYRTKPTKDPKRNDAKRLTGGNTGREKGIITSQKANKSHVNKIKGLEQSVGSLDRRIETALKKGDNATAKDLRSRLNKFTSKLGHARAIQANGVVRGKSGKVLRTKSGNPIMHTAGKEIFDQTKREDFGDPSRKFQNEYPDRFKEMYPGMLHKMGAGIANLYGELSPIIGGGIGKFKKPIKESDPYKMGRDVVTIGGRVVDAVTGLPVIKEGVQTAKNIANALKKGIPDDVRNMPRGIKNALMQNINFPELNLKNIFQPNDIPYYNDIMPGERYPLDMIYGANEEDPFGGRSRDPNYKQPSFSAPLGEDISLADVVNESPGAANDGLSRDIAPYIHPAIDPNKRSDVMNEGYGDIIESGRQDYETLFDEWEKNNSNQTMVPIDQSEFNPDNIDHSQIIETLKGPGYNLKEDIIQELLNSNPDLLNDGNLNSTLSDFYSNR